MTGGRLGRLTASLILCASLAGCAAAPLAVRPLTPPATPGIGGTLPARSSLSVGGNQLLRNGGPFVPRGVTLTGFLAPYPALAGVYADARDAFGPDELASVRGFGADTVRFVVAQEAVATSTGGGGAVFRRSLLDAVSNARALGFVVILALDGSTAGGRSKALAMPDATTARAWAVLAPLFAQDHGIILELFNAPAAAPSAVAWSAWAGGGGVPGQAAVTGMEEMVSAIRADGAGNVLIADGLDHGHTLNGAPLLTDPAQSLLYGVEPYQHSGDGVGSWASDFGLVARSRPVLASEWNASAVPAAGSDIPQMCSDSTPALASALLRYLGSIRVGVVGYAFDLTGTLVRDLSFGLTSYDRFSCGAAGGGPGEILRADFATA